MPSITERVQRFLGIAQLKAEVEQLRAENQALREGKAVITPDGKLAKAEPKKVPFKPRSHNAYTWARRKEAAAWRDMCQEAYPVVRD